MAKERHSRSVDELQECEDALDMKTLRSRVIKGQRTRPEETVEIDPRMQPWDGVDPLGCKTTMDIYEAAKKGLVQVEAKVLGVDNGKLKFFKLDTKKFCEAFKSNDRKKSMRESFDAFSQDGGGIGWGGNTVGHEVIPLLGGPFTKQLYYYDYLRMHALAFYAYHNDPFAKRIVEITRDFVLGRGFKVICETPEAQALWDAFYEVNTMDQFIDWIVLESSVYGENFIWWLPNNETKIGYRLLPGQEVPTGILPRVRLLDPSGIWEIVTYPEDITRVLYYYYNAPTQYQLYGATDGGKPVPTTKYIVQQVPASQVNHFKLNCASNEKRGRSDLYPILSDLKRLRDTIEYMIILMEKQSAWAIDTSIDGNQEDIDSYIQSQQALGTIPDAGSEFVHSTKIKRTYLANEGGASKDMMSGFHAVMNKICSGSGVPYSYFGFSDGSGTTKASALVSTEPIAKKFEKRQDYVGRILKKMASKLFKQFGIESKVEVAFPEIVTQDRSAKFQDLAIAEEMQWISKERASNIAAKELGIDDFNYQKETQATKAANASANPPGQTASPLTAIPQLTAAQPVVPLPTPKGTAPVKPAAAGGNPPANPNSSAVTGQDRTNYRDSYGL